MKDIELLSTETDRRILAALRKVSRGVLLFSCLAGLALVGGLLPPPLPVSEDFPYIRIIDGFLSLSLAGLAWWAVQLFQPMRHAPQWLTIKIVWASLLWLALILALTLWFNNLHQDFDASQPIVLKVL